MCHATARHDHGQTDGDVAFVQAVDPNWTQSPVSGRRPRRAPQGGGTVEDAPGRAASERHLQGPAAYAR